MKAELKERLDSTVNGFLYEWEERHSKFPDYLWHYTSITGVKGILTEHSLWFSDATFLNDSSELSYAVDVAEKIIDQRLEKEQFTLLVQEQLQAFRTKIRRDRESRQAFGFVKPAFVACFCEDGDSLHLWRAYTGNGRGYSVGFFPDVILDQLKTQEVEEIIYVRLLEGGSRKVDSETRFYVPALRQVIYEEEEQAKILGKVIDSFNQILVDFEGEFHLGGVGLKGIFTEKLYSVFYHYLCCFKHPTFKEEKEWRFIYTLSSNQSLSDEEKAQTIKTNIDYRESGGYLVPYLKANIGNVITTKGPGNVADNEKPVFHDLPFDAVTIGPGLEEKLARASLNSYLLRKGFLGSLIEIEHSSIPLRSI